MDNKINSLQPQRLENFAAKSPSPASGNSEDTAAKKIDRVDITPSARTLQQAERRAAEARTEDNSRTERVRQALNDGSYQVDAKRIAQKLLSFEKQVSNKA